MSNYPQPPQYGTPLHPNSYHSSLPGISTTAISQYPFQAPTQPQYMHGQPQARDFPDRDLTTNVHSFNTNDQGGIVHANRESRAFIEQPHRTFPQAHPLPTHTSASNLLDGSQFDQASIQTPQYPSRSSSQQQLGLRNSKPRVCNDNQTSRPEDLKSIDQHESDLEDGEVDDEGGDKVPSPSEAIEMGSTFSKSAKEGHAENNDTMMQTPIDGKADLRSIQGYYPYHCHGILGRT